MALGSKAMQDPALNLAEPHHQAEEFLPWYASGQLEGEDVAMVEQHLSGCAHCRRQLSFDRGMIESMAQLSPEIDSGWARLKRRIERPRASPWDRIHHRAIEAWRMLTRPAIAGLAFAQLAILILAAAFLLQLSRPDYRALNSAQAPEAANVIAIFNPDTTESQMRALLNSTDASVVGGPTSAQAYLLHVPARSRAAVLSRLQSDPQVTMAQPIDGPAS